MVEAGVREEAGRGWRSAAYLERGQRVGRIRLRHAFGCLCQKLLYPHSEQLRFRLSAVAYSPHYVFPHILGVTTLASGTAILIMADVSNSHYGRGGGDSGRFQRDFVRLVAIAALVWHAYIADVVAVGRIIGKMRTAGL